MTSASRICFSLLAVLAVPLLPAASVVGQVELADSAARGNKKSQDFSGAVVWLEPLSANIELPSGAKTATIRQRDKRFTPHVLAVQVGTTVDFPNDDIIFHNAFSTFDGQVFDIGLYPPGTSRQVVFRRPGIVRVFCNIHPMMTALIAVVPTPLFAVTEPSGEFRIADVPTGKYRLKVFHERALPETLAALDRNLDVQIEEMFLDTIRISEAGYAPTPHKNKYGKDYPPSTDEHILYPGVRP